MLSTKIEQLVGTFKDFPKEGIIFKDVLPVLENSEIFSELIKYMANDPNAIEAESIIAIDARCFLFGSALAFYLSKPLIVARKIGNSIWAPSMGRKQEQEDMIEDINYMSYMSWRNWITALGQFNIGIHLMRTHAAGTFAMNCAFHEIPCIGYKGLDTQEILHPLTTVDVGDLKTANAIAKKLRDDEKFYKLFSHTIRKRFKGYYTEDAWKENWKVTNK